MSKRMKVVAAGGYGPSLVTEAGDSIVAPYLPRGARRFALLRIDQILGATLCARRLARLAI